MDWDLTTDAPAPEIEMTPADGLEYAEPEEPVQLDTVTDFETAVITSLNAVHDRLDAIGAQNDWLVTAAQRTHDTVVWIRTTFEQLSAGLLASPMGAMIRNKLPNMEK